MTKPLRKSLLSGNTPTEKTPNPWPLNGYAPGDYFCKCPSCEQQFIGDKRAWNCLECAVAGYIAKMEGPKPLFSPIRKRPIREEHVQLTSENIEALADIIPTSNIVHHAGGTVSFEFTHETGTTSLQLGDFIVKDAEGEYRPYTAGSFYQSYEA